jgi:Fe-S cluster biogenesis protein NfuA
MTDDLRTRTETVLRAAAGELGLDAAALEVLDVTDGIARVRLAAACASCPAGIPMILAGLEQALKEQLPAVEFVEPAG